jgi:hypothetical protein
MIVKFFSRGTGGGDAPVNYLLGEDRTREGASVLRGNAEITKEIINATDYSRRYTAGALSFEESHESITPEQKNQIMNEFEKTLFAGLQPDQYNILWVQHTDKDKRLELNFLIPNQELRTGKRLQPFYVGSDMKRVNAFQNVVNMTYQLSDPHDPSKKRFNSLHFSRSANLKNVDMNKDKKRYKKQLQLVSHKITKNELTAHIYDLAAAARLDNRTAIQKELKKRGLEIARVTDKSISVKSPNFAKNIRLDDPIFGIDFRKENYTAVAMHSKHKQYEKDKQHKILADAQEVLKQGIKIKTEYHDKRFKSANAPEPFDLELDALESAQTLTDELTAQQQPKPTDSSRSLDMGL